MSSIKRDSTACLRPPCENFLYGLQGGPPGRSRRRHGALAFAPADAPRYGGANAGGWREMRRDGPLDIQQVSSVQVRGPCSRCRDCPGPIRTCQGRL